LHLHSRVEARVKKHLGLLVSNERWRKMEVEKVEEGRREI